MKNHTPIEAAYMEAEKKIIGKYGYYCRGTHSGAGAKKWVIA